jgi:ribose-phosphate pyrophosphokinase
MRRILFSMPGNEALGEKVAMGLNAERGKWVCRHFPDGESYIQSQEEVHDAEAIVVCTLDRPDGKLLPLFFLCQLLKDLGAASVVLVAPYLAYMRQDKRFHPGEAVTSEYFATLLSSFVDRLVTIYPHLHRKHAMGELYTVPARALHATEEISTYIRTHVKKPLLVGPDSESHQWVSRVANLAGAPFIVLEKMRFGDEEVRVSVPEVDLYRDHTPVLVDDIVSTARTMIETVNHMHAAGMKAPVCIGVHAVFAGEAFEALQAARVRDIVTCNTIAHPSNGIDISGLIVGALAGS